MKMYSDKDKKIPIKFIDFGMVKVGENKDITVYLENDEKKEIVRLKYKVTGSNKLTKGVTIEEAPSNILPLTTVPIKLRWNPSLDLKIGLKVELKVTGEMIFRGL